jgi:hypothetical protein
LFVGKTVNIKIVLKQVEQAVFVWLNAVCMHPVTKLYHIITAFIPTHAHIYTLQNTNSR